MLERHGGQMPKSSASGPPLTEWSPEVNMLAKIADLQKAGNSILVKINSRPGSSAPKVEPEPRPITVIIKLQAELRWEKHKALAARIVRTD